MKNPISAQPDRAAALAEALAKTIPVQYLRDASLVENVAARWCERQRVWHGPDHLLRMLDEIVTTPAGDARDMLLLTALYHDAIYDPRSGNNEEASAALLLDHALDPQNPVIAQTAEIIIASRWTQPPTTPLAEQFFALDSFQLSDECSLHERLAYERSIFREYQWADWQTYREKRREFLSGWAQIVSPASPRRSGMHRLSFRPATARRGLSWQLRSFPPRAPFDPSAGGVRF